MFSYQMLRASEYTVHVHVFDNTEVLTRKNVFNPRRTYSFWNNYLVLKHLEGNMLTSQTSVDKL
jgi:hypothetical protein